MKVIVAGTLALALTANIVEPRAALARGDDGHKVIALIAQSSAGHSLRGLTRASISSQE